MVEFFFYKNNLLFSVNEIAYQKSIIHIRHTLLYHFEKGWKCMQHSHFAISTNFLAKEQSAKAKLKDATHHIAFLQWTPFGIPLGETPDETQTIFLLTCLKRSHHSTRVSRFFRNGVCSIRCSKSGKIQTRSALCSRRVRGDPSSQIPYFSELFETANDGRMIHIRPAFWLSSFRPLPRLSKVPDRRNLKVDLFIFHLQGLYRPI